MGTITERLMVCTHSKYNTVPVTGQEIPNLCASRIQYSRYAKLDLSRSLLQSYRCLAERIYCFQYIQPSGVEFVVVIVTIVLWLIYEKFQHLTVGTAHECIHYVKVSSICSSLFDHHHFQSKMPTTISTHKTMQRHNFAVVGENQIPRSIKTIVQADTVASDLIYFYWHFSLTAHCLIGLDRSFHLILLGKFIHLGHTLNAAISTTRPFVQQAFSVIYGIIAITPVHRYIYER